jgi:hypothetical protein
MISIGRPIRRPPPPEFSVDEAITNAVRYAGGLLVTDLLPSRTNLPKNADYVFPEYDVIAELKRLEKDRNEDHELSAKIQQLYREWLEQGKRVPLIYGTTQINVRSLPRECAHQIISLSSENRFSAEFVTPTSRSDQRKRLSIWKGQRVCLYSFWTATIRSTQKQ